MEESEFAFDVLVQILDHAFQNIKVNKFYPKKKMIKYFNSLRGKKNFKRSKYKSQQRFIGKKSNGHFNNVIKNNFGPLTSDSSNYRIRTFNTISR